MTLIWIGKYQSDISYTNNYFSGSITYYGDGLGGNISCCPSNSRIYNKSAFIDFIIENIKTRLNQNYFVFYNQSYAYEIINLYPKCKNHIININSKELLNWLANKTLVRLWVKNIINVPPFCAVPGSECTYSNLKFLFPHQNKFVVQDNFSSGGIGSVIIESNCKYKANNATIDPHDLYLVSPLLENSFSVNLHMLIGKHEQVLFPISIQVIEPNKSPFIFRGSDFIEAKQIPKSVVQKVHNCARKIGEKLAGMEYRGICGLDFIIRGNEVYFIEINPRFQGSSFLINRALSEKNLPSLYILNERAFCNESFYLQKNELEKLDVNYSYYKVKSDIAIPQQFISDYFDCSDIDALYMDGFVTKESTVNDYIFRFISKRNIVSLNPNNQINIYPNLLLSETIKLPITSKVDWTNLKTSLLIQGIKIDKSAIVALKKMGGFQEGTFDAIDIRFSNNLVVNCPLKIPFIEFSPYTLRYLNHKFELYVLDYRIDIVSIDRKDAIPQKTTHSDLPFTKMVQRNNDRIRIRHNSICIFKQNGQGCHFCHAKNEEAYLFDLEDIKESFLFYLQNIQFDQIMIGGASNHRKYESMLIKNIIRFIRKYTDKPIYIMSIPPLDFNEIYEYKMLGANEIAFNIEIFDDNIAKTLMPGKGIISRNEYLEALQRAVDVFGNRGQVRSMLIVGLEPLESFKRGIEALCQIGVSPMISPFRPMRNTKLEYFVPPDFNECQNYIETALEITKKYNIELGPLNIVNQNNTFNFVNI